MEKDSTNRVTHIIHYYLTNICFRECEGKAVEVKKSLGMDKVSGIFAFLGFGLFAALIIATTEKAFSKKRKLKSKETTNTEMRLK